MKLLIAICPVLFENTNYKSGDKLPTHDTELVTLWIANGTAVWKNAEEFVEKPKEQKIKAKQMTAPAGLPGDAYPSVGSEQDDLVGKLPAKKARDAQIEPIKGRRKSSA